MRHESKHYGQQLKCLFACYQSEMMFPYFLDMPARIHGVESLSHGNLCDETYLQTLEKAIFTRMEEDKM